MAKVTLKDVTAATWKTLSNPPDGTATPPEPSALCLKDVPTCKKDTADRATAKPFYARNSDWNPRPLPNITKPISWPFLKSPIFKKSSIAKWDILNLAFVASPPAGYTVRIYSVTYSSGANLPPAVVGVAFPMDLDISKPPPFLVHYKHIPGQVAASTLFKYFDPLGYDWLAWEIWGWLNFNAMLTPGGSFIVNMPFLSPQQSSFGLCYQLRQANKQYVIVLPQISRVFDPASGRLRDYQLYSAATLRNLLVAIQKDILSIEDESLFHVAISANSSGCNVVSTFLTDGVAAMKTDKAVDSFMRDELNELFVFDPPENFGDAMVPTIEPWRKLAPTSGPTQGKCVRFYTHSFTKNLATLAGGTNPFKSGVAGFWESKAKTESLAYLPFSRDLDDVWQHTYDEVVPGGTMPVSNFAFVHHAIPALCVTDAASRSLYV
jgi:hypothetical protein